MEIKKYVLLKNNSIGKLYERYNLGFLYVEEKGGTVYIKNASLSDIKMTSDNILDLVEVGDMVGYRFWGEDYENIDKMRDEQNIKNDIKYNGDGFVIVAIYKRQTNGDYKRYEVSEKI